MISPHGEKLSKKLNKNFLVIFEINFPIILSEATIKKTKDYGSKVY